VQRRRRVARELGHVLGDGVGSGGVFFGAADVDQRATIGALDDVDVRVRELGVLELRVIGAQGMKLAAVWVQQGGARALRAFDGGEQVHFGGHKGLGGVRQGIQGFGDDLRAQARDGKQDAALVLGWGGCGGHGFESCRLGMVQMFVLGCAVRGLAAAGFSRGAGHGKPRAGH